MSATSYSKALLVAFALTGCQDDPWIFRPRDAGRVADLPLPPDGDVGDASAPLDGDVRDAIAPLDGPAPADGTAPDVSVATDGIAEDRMPPVGDGPDATALSLRANGCVTTGGEPQQVGSLRLTETGFELGERACAGPLCLAGGLIP